VFGAVQGPKWVSTLHHCNLVRSQGRFQSLFIHRDLAAALLFVSPISAISPMHLPYPAADDHELGHAVRRIRNKRPLLLNPIVDMLQNLVASSRADCIICALATRQSSSRSMSHRRSSAKSLHALALKLRMS
jgi:hypothetical protein